MDTLKQSEAKRQQLSFEVEGLLKRIHEQGLQLTEQDKQNALLREEALSASNQLKVAKQEASATIKKYVCMCVRTCIHTYVRIYVHSTSYTYVRTYSL